jgi:hypothetical protein
MAEVMTAYDAEARPRYRRLTLTAPGWSHGMIPGRFIYLFYEAHGLAQRV